MSGALDRPAAAAGVLDGWLRRLGRQEALCRRVLGALAERFLAIRACHSLGFARLSDWTRERLGRSARELQELARTSTRLRSLPAIGEAFDRGELSWAKVRLLTRVADAENEGTWVMLARERPVRAPEQLIRDAPSEPGESRGETVERSSAGNDKDDDDDDTCDGEALARFAVPCPRSVLTSWNRAVELARRMAGEQLPIWQAAEAIAAGWHRRLARFGVQDSVIAFSGPESVVVLLKTAMRAFGAPHEPAWSRLERLLLHVRIEWQSQPRHRDPIFDRDGWRCAVPACSSRKNLHDHHVLFRSRGGSDDLGNRTTVCAWHHLRGIHEGRIRAFGRAPHEIVWEIGRQPSGAPLFRARGDRYVAAAG